MKRRGSITIFAALALMLVAQLLFTLLEGARCLEMDKVAVMNTDSVLESVFADYCTPLWETYHLLGVTAADGEGTFSLNNREAQVRNLTGENLGSKGSVAQFSGVSLLSAEMVDVSFEPYLLMSDQGGEVFEAAVCAYMKENFAYEAAKSIYNNYEAVGELKKSYGDSGSQIDNAIDALEEAKEAKETEEMPNMKGSGKGIAEPQNSSAQGSSEEENPLTAVAQAKQRGVLSLVLPKNTALSDAKLQLEQTVSHRQLQTGTGEPVAQDDWYQRVLLNQYFVNYLACYTNPKENRAMKYELEYLIAGKAADTDNLRTVVGELLAIREVLNMASLVASPEKQEEAFALAMALAGFTLNPIIIEIVKYGILAAWAFVESVLDLRTLLDGGKITLLKNQMDWTSNVHNIPELLSGWSQAKNCPQGLGYTDYLSLVLLFHGGEKLAMRAMDVQELTVCMRTGYENFRMDHLLCEAKITATYEYCPVFLGFVSLLQKRADCFRIQNNSEYSYFMRKEDV